MSDSGVIDREAGGLLHSRMLSRRLDTELTDSLGPESIWPAHGRILFYLNDTADFTDAFSWFEERGTRHSVLRGFETLPEVIPGNIELLVRTEDLEQILENPFLSSEPGGVLFEIHVSDPLGHEDELLHYPTWLARRILSSRRRLASGVFAPGEGCYLKSLAYHVVFHGAEPEKRPASDQDFGVVLPKQYLANLQELSAKASPSLEFMLDGLWSYLGSVSWLPPVGLARRYAIASKNPWLVRKVGPLAGARENVLVFVFRDWLLRQPEMLYHAIREIERLGLQRIELVELTEEEKHRAHERIRGGNWFETSESREGGGPAAFAVFFDPCVERPSEEEKFGRPFCANRKLAGKSDLEERFCKDYNEGNRVNFLHASDDEREGMEYLECLAPERLDRLLDEIGAFRRAEGC